MQMKLLQTKTKKNKLLTMTLGGIMSTIVLSPVFALTINLTDIGGVGTGSQAEIGFQAAAQLWEDLLGDSIDVNIDVGFSVLGSGILGSTATQRDTFTYSDFTTALIADQTSTDDFTAISNLQAGSDFDILINRTNDNPNGSGSATFYVDHDASVNNQTIRMSLANAKALGLLGASATKDAEIQFNSDFTFDFDRSDGISAGAFYFIGIAAHEIGHALGFTSGVDILDSNSTGTFFNEDAFTWVNTLDMFRYSTDSVISDALDWTADNRDKYFSIDGGISNLGLFSTGTTYGDGRQASHWKDNLGLGLMDPTTGTGEQIDITALDSQAFDVIGWDLISNNQIPVPGTFALFALGLIGLYRRHLI